MSRNTQIATEMQRLCDVIALRQSGGFPAAYSNTKVPLHTHTHTQMTHTISSCATLLHRQRTHLYGAGSKAFQILSQRMEARSQQGKNVCAGCSLNIPARSTSDKHDLFWKKLLNHVTKLDLMHLLPGIHNIYKIQWIWNWKHSVWEGFHHQLQLYCPAPEPYRG